MTGEYTMAQLRVKEVAEKKGWDTVELSRQSRVAYSVILRMFNDPAYNATLETLQKVAKALGVRVADLLAEDPPN
jgi:DNA-binding Xre family transcriptional regulator